MTTIILLYKRIGFFEAKGKWLACKYVNRESKRFIENYGMIKKLCFIIDKKLNQLRVIFDNEQVDELVKYGKEQQIVHRLEEEIRIEKANRPVQVELDTTAIFNATQIEIPVDIQLVFSWGPKFLFPYLLTDKNLPIFLAQMEDTISQLVHPGAVDHTILQVKQAISNQNSKIFDTDIHWILFIKHRTDEFLTMHKNIKPIISDKGKVTIIMYLREYESKMQQHLSNNEYYMPYNSDPVCYLAAKECQMIQVLRDNPKTKRFTKAYQTKCMILPKMYGNIKTHKENKIRPITSNAGNTVGAQLNNILNELLTVIFPVNDRHILNSSQMKKFIDETMLGEDHVLVSFDAVSMFTNIPTGVVMNIVNENLQSFEDGFDLDRKFVMRMFHFILNECVFFSSLGRIYKQKTGLPMGGSISPICCRLVMDRVIDNLVLKPYFIKVYVDDTLVALRKKEIEPMLEQMNRFHKNIQFTVEIEKDCQINFLNMTVMREGQSMITKWYRKPYASLRLLNFYSSHKRAVIRNTAIHFIKTILELSDAKFFVENRELILKTLRINCFPEIEIIKLMQYYTLMIPLYNNKKQVAEYYVPIPFCNVKYNRISKVITNNMNMRIKSADSIKNMKINPIRNIKDFTPLCDRSNMIVQVTCKCRTKTKIGMTKFNQLASELVDEMKNDKVECNDNGHSFCRHKIIKGLSTRTQTRHYLNYLQFRFYEALYNKTEISLPNKHFRSLL